MAKISAAAKSLPLLALFAKYHFWLLAAIVPMVLLPLLFLARGELFKTIEAQRATINGHIKAIEAITKGAGEEPHPNDAWINSIDKSTVAIKQATFTEWRRFWKSQQPLRVWPATLGPDFVKAVEALPADGKLPRQLLERYRDNAPTLVRDLPKRMGVEDAIVESLVPGDPQPQAVPRAVPGRAPGGAAGARAEAATYHMKWSAENQNRIAASFKWDKVPSTTRVLLAQEELWVYGLFCNAVARVNASATGSHDAAISAVDELFVGYPAAEDNPGGRAGGRIVIPAAQQEGGGGASPAAQGDTATGVRPPHPRFPGTTTGGPAAPMAAGEQGGAANSDALLRNWIYVDFSGKPLDAAELAAAADCQMVHLMPFVLRIVIDERRIDSLLVELATSSIPIDVRQLRINAEAAGSVGGQPGADAGASATGSGGRFYDVKLELRGTVGLATLPNNKTVELEPGQAPEPASEAADEQPAQAPKAAVRDPLIGRRSVS